MRRSSLRANIQEIAIESNTNSLLVRAFTDFLKNKLIWNLHIKQQDFGRDRSAWLYLTENLRFENIVMHSLLDKGYLFDQFWQYSLSAVDHDFIFRTADIAMSLWIFIKRLSYSINQCIPLFRDILRKKCDELVIVFEDSSKFTVLEAEKLVNVCENI